MNTTLKIQAIRASMKTAKQDDSLLGAIETKLGEYAQAMGDTLAANLKESGLSGMSKAYRSQDRVYAVSFGRSYVWDSFVVEVGWTSFQDQPWIQVWGKLPSSREEFSQKISFSPAFSVGMVSTKLTPYFVKHINSWLDSQGWEV